MHNVYDHQSPSETKKFQLLQQQHQSISIFTYLFVHRCILIIHQITRYNKATAADKNAAAAAAVAATAQLLLLLQQLIMLQEQFYDSPATLESNKIIINHEK